MNLTGFLLPLAMVGIGIALLVRTLAGGGGPLAAGLVTGLLFIGAGAGRIYVERRRP